MILDFLGENPNDDQEGERGTASSRESYPTDLNDKEWELISPLLPPARLGGRSRGVDLREVVNAIAYVIHSGYSWRMLPHDFPNWSTVYGYFSRWAKDGTLEHITTHLRVDIPRNE